MMAHDGKGTRYYPSNGTEGADFQQRWCERCAKDDGVTSFGDPEGYQCDILARSYVEDVAEWVYDAERCPCCTVFELRKEPKPYKCPETLDLFDAR